MAPALWNPPPGAYGNLPRRRPQPTEDLAQPLRPGLRAAGAARGAPGLGPVPWQSMARGRVSPGAARSCRPSSERDRTRHGPQGRLSPPVHARPRLRLARPSGRGRPRMLGGMNPRGGPPGYHRLTVRRAGTPDRRHPAEREDGPPRMPRPQRASARLSASRNAATAQGGLTPGPAPRRSLPGNPTPIRRRRARTYRGTEHPLP